MEYHQMLHVQWPLPGHEVGSRQLNALSRFNCEHNSQAFEFQMFILCHLNLPAVGKGLVSSDLYLLVHDVYIYRVIDIIINYIALAEQADNGLW